VNLKDHVLALPLVVQAHLPRSGFRVQDAGFRVQGSGFRVQGSGFRVQGSGFRVQGLGCRVSGFRFRVSGGKEEVLPLRRTTTRLLTIHSRQMMVCYPTLTKKTVLVNIHGLGSRIVD